MEAVAIISLVALALIIWKLIEVKDNIEQVNARLNNIDVVLAAYYKMLKELQPPKPVEIPVRLDNDTLKEVVPQLYKKPEMDPTQDDIDKIESFDDKWDEIEVPEPNEALVEASNYYKKKVLTENENKY